MNKHERDVWELICANPPCCPVCGSDRAACPNLEAATPEPDRWCPLLEDALEVREWKRWAYRYQKRERFQRLNSFGYWSYQQRKFAHLRQRNKTVAALMKNGNDHSEG
jgi:hypothetical protein